MFEPPQAMGCIEPKHITVLLCAKCKLLMYKLKYKLKHATCLPGFFYFVSACRCGLTEEQTTLVH